MTVKSLTFEQCYENGIADANAGLRKKRKSNYSLKQYECYSRGYNSVPDVQIEPIRKCNPTINTLLEKALNKLLAI